MPNEYNENQVGDVPVRGKNCTCSERDVFFAVLSSESYIMPGKVMNVKPSSGFDALFMRKKGDGKKERESVWLEKERWSEKNN